MGRRVRGLWPLAAAVVIVMVTAVVLVLVWRSPRRADLEGFAGLAITVSGIAVGLITRAWRTGSQRASGVVSGQELERLADLLARTVDAEWTRVAGERGLLEPVPIPVRWQRPSVSFTGPVAAAVASTRFAPLPGLAPAGEERVQAGQVSELHKLYGGLGSGRLVIAGGPGSGKSSAAVLLTLAALRYRRGVPEETRPEVPVPVMFTLHGWDPGSQRARDWLAERLWRTYPLFAGRRGAEAAQGMLDDGRIAVILDGLDEIPQNLRPAVLQALSQEAAFRLVLLTRSAEMAVAAARAMLQGAAAIELQPVAPGTAADYLTRTQLDPPPQRWDELTSSLRQEPGGPLAQALDNPLMLTLVRDTYRAGDNAGELLGLRDAAGKPASNEDITGHLLDRVLPAAYTSRPGQPPPRYDLPTAERALRRIAARMSQEGTRDLQWWHVPAWARADRRVSVTMLSAWIAAGIAAGTGIGVVNGAANGIGAGIAAGLLVSIVAGFVTERRTKIPRRISPVRLRQLFGRGPLGAGLLAGLATGLVTYTPAGLAAWPGAGIATALAVWLGTGLLAASSRSGSDGTSPLSPLASWHSDQAHGLAVGLVTGLWTGLAVAFAVWLGAGHLMTGITAGITAGLAIGVAVGLAYPQSWSSSLAFAQLAKSDRTPVRLMRFLEDARSRGVLRTVGPAYQFRHARLQDRLAAQQPETGQPA